MSELEQAIETLKEYEKMLGKIRFEVNSLIADLHQVGDVLWSENRQVEDKRKELESADKTWNENQRRFVRRKE